MKSFLQRKNEYYIHLWSSPLQKNVFVLCLVLSLLCLSFHSSIESLIRSIGTNVLV